MTADRGRLATISVLGVTQILASGSTYYLPAVLAKPVATDTGWPLSYVAAGLSAGLFAAGLVSPGSAGSSAAMAAAASSRRAWC